MAEKNLSNIRIVNKHDTEENWLKATGFTPKQGELIVYDIDDNYSYERIKIGDGVQNVSDLPFAANRSFVVTASRDADKNTVVDKTYQEIYDAVQAGMNVYMITGDTIYVDGNSMWPDTILWLSYCSDYSVIFTHHDGSSEFEIEINLNGGVSVYYSSSLPSKYSFGYEGMVLTVGENGEVNPADFPETIARTSDVEEVKELVGDKSVSEQINTAMDGIIHGITAINKKLTASEILALEDGLYYFPYNCSFYIYLYDSWSEDETAYVSKVHVEGICKKNGNDIYVYDLGVCYWTNGNTRVYDNVEYVCCATESARQMYADYAGMYELPTRGIINISLRQYSDGTIEYDNSATPIEDLRSFGWGVHGVLTQCTINTNNTSKYLELYEVTKLIGDDYYLYGIQYAGYKDGFLYNVVCEVNNKITVEKTSLATQDYVKSFLPKATTVTLPAANWIGDANPWSQVVAVNGVTANSKIDLQPTAVQIVEMQNNDIALIAENNDGVVTVYAIGSKPTKDYTMQALITEVTVV